MSRSSTPPAKRVKLESPTLIKLEDGVQDESKPEEEELEGDRCSICLQEVADRTVVPVCAHEFCFDCLIVWTGQSRRCPLCSQAVGDFLIHKIRSRYDYQKHYLNPLPTSPVPLQPLPPRQIRAPRRRPRNREWGRPERTERDEADKLDRSIARRRWIYEHDLYAKHVASNSYTRYRPYPTPAQFAASPDLISRTIMFLRRELQVWVNLDVEFLTTFIISIMKAIDIRSESAVKLLSEFLDLDAPYVEGGRHVNAEHFAHEVYTFVRSPYKDLFIYDTVVQYDVSAEIPALVEAPRRRWEREYSRSPSPRVSPEETRRARSRSRSPQHRSSRDRELNEHTSRGTGRRQLRNASRPRDPIGANRTRGRIEYNQTEDLPLPLGAATETAEAQARNRDIGATSSKDPVFTAAQEEERRTVEDPAPPSECYPPKLASLKPPRVRNRSLLESVQAHLGGPSRKARENNVKTLHDSAPATSSSKPFDDAQSDSVPSLLARLSEPGTRQSISRKNTESVSRKILEVATPSNSEQAKEPTLSGYHTKTALPAPEIMARTRARLAKSAAIDSDSHTQDYLSLGGGVGSVPPPPLSTTFPSLSLEQGSQQDGNSDISTSSGLIGGGLHPVATKSDPRRTKLLSRLEEEKDQARAIAAAPSAVATALLTEADVVTLDRISQGQQPKSDVASSGGFPLHVVDVDATEARLRRQAQLRVRLAAEKRRRA
ncbi:hypothetical protein C8R43DRAFT_1135918 [Mycena crocata]|nr:hypothetical protein C8R43DRAFT_1135918 [Mycena crocata]